MLEKKDLSTLDEFVLRCIDAAIEQSEEIAEFLGLSPRMVETVMARLVAVGHLAPAKPTTGMALRFILTERGRAVLVESGEVRPTERTLALSYDGLLRQFSFVEPTLRWRPRDLRESGVLEIPAFPADPPDVGPADTATVTQALFQVSELSKHDILTVLGVDGRREKFFVRALALIFEAIDGCEVSVQFAIDGRPSEPHDLAFARAEGQRKLGIVGSLREQRGPVEEVVAKDILALRSDDSDAPALRRATDALNQRIELLQEQIVAADGPNREQMERTVARLELRLEQAEAALSRSPVRLLAVHEHPRLLADALESAQDRLMIVSPWISATVVDDEFMAAIERCLARGVKVSIGYGIDDGRGASRRDRQAEDALGALSQSTDGFNFKRLGDTHAKVLVVDRQHVIVTSFNWLSFRGDPNRPFRDERGTLVAVPDEIDRIYEDYIGRLLTSTE